MRTTVAALAILLCAAPPARGQCAGCEGDIDGDDQVTVSELVQAVNSLLNGCQDRVECDNDDDCDADETCVDGTCVGRPDPCDTDDDCDADERCVDGNCE